MNNQEYNKEYYKKNKDKINSKRKKIKVPLTDEEIELRKLKEKQRMKEYNKEYYKADGYNKKYNQKQRIKTLDLLGGKCVRCGFDDYRALQIDHINGGGHKERKELGFNGSFHKNVMNSHSNNENKYQLLCANCNWIKRVENKECAK